MTTTEISVCRARDVSGARPGKRYYRVDVDGFPVAHIPASDVVQAIGIARQALKRASESPYVQSLRFSGAIRENETPRSDIVTALRHLIEERQDLG